MGSRTLLLSTGMNFPRGGYRFIFGALFFLCPAILLGVAGAGADTRIEEDSTGRISSSAGSIYKSLNYRSKSEPPNFEFVTKKQEKRNYVKLNLKPPVSHLPSTSGPSITPSQDQKQNKILNSAASSESDLKSVSSIPNDPSLKALAIALAIANLDQKLKSDNKTQEENQQLEMTGKDPQEQKQQEQQEPTVVIKNDADDDEEVERIARRVSGTGPAQGLGIGPGLVPGPRLLQNQYGKQKHPVGVGGDRNFKGWSVIDNDERGQVWPSPNTPSRNPIQNSFVLNSNANANRGPGVVGTNQIQGQSKNQIPSQNLGPDGKTISHLPSLPTLDIVEDPGYDHGPRPKWPLNEYLADKFNSFYRPNYYEKTRNKSELNEHTKHNVHQQLHQKGYEWQQLQPSQHHLHHHQQQHFGSTASESHHNYDSTKFYHLDDENFFVNQDQTRNWNNDNYNNNLYGSHGHGLGLGHGHGHNSDHKAYASLHGEQQAGTNEHETTVSTSTDVSKGISSSSAGVAGSSSRDVVKHGLPNVPYGHAHHYFPPDYYPKKRFRLQIHPGYIAAPIAGLAAFGAASALTKKPLLFELGLVNNKHHYPRPLHYPGHPGYGHGYGYGHGHGHGWSSNVVPNYYPVNPPIIPHAHPTPTNGPTYPIIKPEVGASHHHKPSIHSHLHSHNHHHNYGWGHQQNQNQHNHNHHSHNHHGHGHGHGHHHHHHSNEVHHVDKKPWWNPFAALTPRD